MEALTNYEGCPEDRIRGAVQKALVGLVDLAIERQVAFVLLAGDLFDRKPRDIQPGLFFNTQMRRLKEKGIRVFAIAGNHDAESSTWRNIPRAEVEYLPDDKAGTLTLEANGIPVAIHGQSYPKASVKTNLTSKYPAAELGHFNIGLLHTSLDNPESAHKTYAPCKLSELVTKDYDYWALGHIHIPQVLQETPHILYPGNLQGRSVRETGPRGCYLVQVDANRKVTSCEPQELDHVRWFEKETAIGGLETLQDVREQISRTFQETNEEAGQRLAILRLHLTGETELSPALHRDIEDLRADFLDLANEAGVWLEKIKIRTTSTQAPETTSAPNLPDNFLQDLQVSAPPMPDDFFEWEAISKLLSKIPRDIKTPIKTELAAALPETTSSAKAELQGHLLGNGRQNP